MMQISPCLDYSLWVTVAQLLLLWYKIWCLDTKVLVFIWFGWLVGFFLFAWGFFISFLQKNLPALSWWSIQLIEDIWDRYQIWEDISAASGRKLEKDSGVDWELFALPQQNTRENKGELFGKRLRHYKTGISSKQNAGDITDPSANGVGGRRPLWDYELVFKRRVLARFICSTFLWGEQQQSTWNYMKMYVRNF